jgi:hypothetical protein
MATDIRPIRTKRDYEAVLKGIERGARRAATTEGDRLDVLAILIDAYEAEHLADGSIRSNRGHQVPHGAASLLRFALPVWFKHQRRCQGRRQACGPSAPKAMPIAVSATIGMGRFAGSPRRSNRVGPGIVGLLAFAGRSRRRIC